MQWKWPVRTPISSRKQIWVSRQSLQSLHGDRWGPEGLGWSMMGCIELGWRSRNFSAWWWLEPWHNLWLSTSWECHHPNWLILYNITYIYIYIYFFFFLGSYLLGEKRGSLILKFDFSPFLVDNLRGPAAGGLVFFLRAGSFGSDWLPKLTAICTNKWQRVSINILCYLHI